MKRILCSLSAALSTLGTLAVLAAPARAAATDWVGDTHAAARLLAVHAGGTPDTLNAGIEIRLAAGWHTYWRTPGDAGFAASVDWSGSGNVTAVTMAWPAPSRLVIEGLQNNVYEGDVVLPVLVGIARNGKPVRLQATIRYAACAEACVPYHAELALTLPAGEAADRSELGILAAARARVPGDLATASAHLISATLDGAASPPVLAVTLRSVGQSFVAPDLFVEGAGSEPTPAEGRAAARRARGTAAGAVVAARVHNR